MPVSSTARRARSWAARAAAADIAAQTASVSSWVQRAAISCARAARSDEVAHLLKRQEVRIEGTTSAGPGA